MLNLNYCYRIYPDTNQEEMLLELVEICRRVYNYALAERKDWINSRKLPVKAGSIEKKYIIPIGTSFPDYYRQKKALTSAKKEFPERKSVYSQVLQERIGRLDRAFHFCFAGNEALDFPDSKSLGNFAQ